MRLGRKYYKGVQLPQSEELAKELGVSNMTVKLMRNKKRKELLLLGLLKKYEIDKIEQHKKGDS